MTRNKPLVILSGILLGITLLSSYGCRAYQVGGGAATGAATYMSGKLRSIERAPLDKTWQAAQNAVEDLGFNITSREKTTVSSSFTAEGANKKQVSVYLQKISEELTEVITKVGWFGDESVATLFLGRLKENLGIETGVAAEETAVFVKGDLKSMVNAPVDITWEAAQKAVEDLKLPITNKQKDVFSGNLTAVTANNETIVITLQKSLQDLTETAIRVGSFGDLPLSRIIFEELEKNLGDFYVTPTGMATYTLGGLESLEKASLDRTWEAAQKALEDLSLPVTSKQKEDAIATIIARGENDVKIETNLLKQAEDLTKVRIRVGDTGDESLSRRILEKMKQHLGEVSEVSEDRQAARTNGELKSVIEAPIDETWEAVQNTVEELELPVIREQRGDDSATLIARDENDEQIEINLQEQPEDLTEITISTEDESLSQQILAKLETRL